MKKIQLMNTYISNLAILNNKLHNLHWNVVGVQFMPVHNFTEELYDDFFAKFDDVAEQVKILGESPLATTKDYLEAATVEEIAPRDFNRKEVLEIVKADIELMRDLATDIRNLADEEGDFVSVALFEDHVAGFNKNLWFLQSMLK
jgi:starvation-inducible DNA-binding protein